MANVLQGLPQPQDKDRQNYQMMMMLSQTNPQTLLGYKIGQYLSNYFERGQERGANKLASGFTPDQAARNAEIVKNNTMSGMKLDEAKNAWEAMNPSISNASSSLDGLQKSVGDAVNGGNGLPPDKTSDTSSSPSGADWASLAMKFGDVGSSLPVTAPQVYNGPQPEVINTPQIPTTDNQSNGILAGLGASQTAAQMAQQSGQSTNDYIQKLQQQQANSLTQALADANAKKQQTLDTALKIASFFDPAASASQAGAATPANQVDNSISAAVKQAMLDHVSPQGKSDGLSDLIPAAAAALGASTGVVPRLSPEQELAERKIQNDILRTKMAYQIAQQKGDEAGMAQAHAQADIIRSTASKMGLGNSLMTADDNIQQAIDKKNQDDYTEQIRRVVNPEMSTQEYFNSVYNKLRDAGYGYDVSNRVASQKAQDYQAHRVNTLSNRFSEEGLSQTGAVNNLGAQVLTQLAAESPQTYQALVNMYAMPKNDYDFNNAIKQAVNNEALQKDLAGFNSGLHMKESDHNLGNTIKLNDHNLGNTMQLKQFEAKLNVQQKAALAQIELQVQGMAQEQQYAIKYQAAKKYGADDSTAKAYALGGISGRGEAAPKTKVPKYSEPLSTAMNNVFKSIQNVKPGGDTTESADAMEKYQDVIAKYDAEMDDEDRAYANDMMYVFNFLRSKRSGKDEDNAAKYYEAVPDYLKEKYLQGY